MASQEVPGAPAAGMYFYEDEVFTVDKRGRVKMGVIVCSGTISDSEDEDYVDPGKVRVAWHPDGKEGVVSTSQVGRAATDGELNPETYEIYFQLGLVDRTLAPGDVVRRLDPSTGLKQFGYCQEMTVSADMNVVGTNFVIKNIPAKRCAPLHRMTTGAVLLDSWIGVSDMIKEKLVLQTSCGSLIEVVLCAEQSPLWDIEDNPRGSYFSTPTFHVGQILVGPVSALENAKWLYTSPEMRGSRKNKTVNRKFVVQSVELDEVTIYWQIKPNIKVNNGVLDEISYTEPPSVVRGEDLKRIKPMNVFEAYMLQINDKHQVVVQEGDEVVMKSEWKKEQANKYQIIKEQQRANSKNNLPMGSPGGKRKKVQDGLPGVVKVVVSAGETASEVPSSKEGIAVDAKGMIAATRQNNNNLKPLQRQPSNEKAECQSHPLPNPHHHHQFLTVLDAKRTHSLESNETDSTAEEDETSASHSGSDFSSNTLSSCSNTTTPRSSPKCSPLLATKLKRFHQHNRKKKRSSGEPLKLPETGQTVVARALVVYSSVTVLWQDGSLEPNIPSRELFPMHTLDHHEFFPGDFVLHGTAEDLDTDDLHNYGVIQTMDHVGRLARVKWFETGKGYDQDPQYKGETEVSVYDLKDHLQFQYRPGTIVVRLRVRVVHSTVDEKQEGDEAQNVENDEKQKQLENEKFKEEEEEEDDDGGQLGQVIDNSPDGKVKVVWVNGKVSSCWPQDIFELGNYDSGMFISHDHLNFGDLDGGGAGGGDDSWMTESEESHLGDQSNNKVTPADRLYLSESLERLKVSIVRLKMLFKGNPQVLSPTVVHELMVIYKKCRYFDRLMDTQFFHEENFEGLVERVRKTAALGGGGAGGKKKEEPENGGDAGDQLAPPEGFLSASHSTPIKMKERGIEKSEKEGLKGIQSPSGLVFEDGIVGESNNKIQTGVAQIPDESVLNILVISEEQQQGGDQERKKKESIKKGDSGHYSEMDEDQSSSSSMGHHQVTVQVDTEEEDKDKSTNSSVMRQELSKSQMIPMELMCSKFCNLLKIQLSKAFHEINTLYCTPNTEWEVVKEESTTTIGADESVQSQKIDDSLNTTTEGEEINVSEGGAEDGCPGAPPESFLVVDSVPTTHQYNLSLFNPKVPKIFYRAVKREHDMLRTGLPEGVWVRAYEERLDLFSVMIEGPKNTPYEDGVFLFDIQLGNDYPEEPPNCHYISYCHDRLNPNLYEEGRVCVSLLGTWSGKGTEKWGPNSSLLQLIVSLQGLILVAEPYFNEAGYEKQVGTQQGCENSQIYNEMVVIKLLQSMIKLIDSPPDIYRERILNHFRKRGLKMIERISGWVEMSRSGEENEDIKMKPDFPLVPASRGFCITVESLLAKFKQVIERL